MNNTIGVCLSVNPYQEKIDRDKIGDIRYKMVEIPIYEFYKLVLSGYAYTSVMKNNWRNRDNFICTRTITYDIDNADVPMGECIDTLCIEPTFAYTTSSNGIEGKGYRYRLVYVTDEMCTVEEYAEASKALASILKLKWVDKRSFMGEQFWFGNASAESVYTGNIILINDIIKNNIIKNNNDTGDSSRKSVSQNIIIHTQHYIVSGTFLQDYRTMSFKDLIEKYRDTYENRERTSIDIDEDKPIIEYPVGYYEIRRPWQKINGETLKIKDGEGRRRKLFLNGIIRRKIYPEITFDNLLYNLVYEFYYYYINDGNKIDKRILYEIANNVMKEDISKYEELGKPLYKSFVNQLYCDKHGLTKKQALGSIRNKKQYIGELYDCSKTDQENISIMKECGLDISLRTLKRWKKENGIRKNKIVNKN